MYLCIETNSTFYMIFSFLSNTNEIFLNENFLFIMTNMEIAKYVNKKLSIVYFSHDYSRFFVIKKNMGEKEEAYSCQIINRSFFLFLSFNIESSDIRLFE